MQSPRQPLCERRKGELTGSGDVLFISLHPHTALTYKDTIELTAKFLFDLLVSNKSVMILYANYCHAPYISGGSVIAEWILFG